MSFERFHFKGWDACMYAVKPSDEIEMPHFDLTFNSTETFSEIVKRIASSQPDTEVKKAVYALENEMGRRMK